MIQAENVFHATIVGGLALAGTWGWYVRRPRLRGSTLAAPWNWMGLSLWAVAVVEILLLVLPMPGNTASLLRFVVAMTAFCPSTAILGAKRPQHRAWQWIVLSLWVVLILPAGEALLFPTESGLRLGMVRGIFLGGLCAVGIANYTATPRWPAAWTLGFAQFALATPFLPGFLGGGRFQMSPLMGLAALVCSITWDTFLSDRHSAATSPLEALWLDFRNGHGILWSLRVAERVNLAAKENGWPVELAWSGPKWKEAADPANQTETAVGMQRILRSLLRRFVSDAWITARENRAAMNHEDSAA